MRINLADKPFEPKVEPYVFRVQRKIPTEGSMTVKALKDLIKDLDDDMGIYLLDTCAGFATNISLQEGYIVITNGNQSWD